MSTLVLCRTCGEKIYNLNAKNLFDQESYEMLDKIEILTGIRLDDDEDMPKHICACCYLDLNHAIAFRERCIKIQQLLHSGVEANAAAPDPLNTAEGRVPTPTPGNRKKQPQRKVVRALTEPCHTSPQNHIVRACSPKQQLSINTRTRGTRDSSGQLRRRVIILREAEAECDKTRNILSLAKASSVRKSKRIAMEEAQQSASEDYDSATSDGSRNKMKCNARQTGIGKTYVCDQCGKCFTDSSNLKVHILRHTGVKNFECEECNTKYFTRHLLNLHIRVRHQGEMPYACKYCDQRFFTSTSRCRHERVKHTRTLTYACRLCGKTYLTKSCLNKHEFLHTGERPYRCDICNVGFPRNTNLKIHYRSKQHQKRATEALDKQFNIIEAISGVESDIDSNIEDFDV